MSIDIRTQVQSVRKQTGNGLFFCKRALEKTGWDVDRAVDLLLTEEAEKAKEKAEEHIFR